jgi:hypothetical protein
MPGNMPHSYDRVTADLGPGPGSTGSTQPDRHPDSQPQRNTDPVIGSRLDVPSAPATLTILPTLRPRLARLFSAIAWAAIFALWCLHWVHLSADFPNFSPWMDYSKYTDEGWYGNAAMRSILFGHWFLPGDFNPSVALPIWPALEWVAFRLAGVHAEVARGLALLVFGGNLLLSYALVRTAGLRRPYALGALLLLAASHYLWAFSRLAILEPLLSFWTLAAWLLALRLRSLPKPRRTLSLSCVSLLCALAVLTKTTAIFLFPAMLALLFLPASRVSFNSPLPVYPSLMPRIRSNALSALRIARPFSTLAWAMLPGLLLWGAYYLVANHFHALDFHYLFIANSWEPPHGLHDHLLAFWWAAHGLLFLGPHLVCTFLVLLLLCALVRRGSQGAPPSFALLSLASSPLLWPSLLAIAGYIFFIGWHNSPQPRYYMVLAYPVVFLTLLAVQSLADATHALPRWLARAAVATLAWVVLVGTYQSLYDATHPQYTLRAAAQGLAAYIDSHPQRVQPLLQSQASHPRSPLLLSISGDELTLFTHLPAICDDFGTDPLPERILRYHPAWYAQWNELDAGTLDDIHTAGYRLQPVANWHAFDDEDRNNLILYRLIPLAVSSH